MILVDAVEDKFNKIRLVLTRIKCPNFQKMLEGLNKEKLVEVEKMIENLDIEALDNFYKANCLELGEMSISELKAIARRLNVPDWSRVPKHVLIRRIPIYEKRGHDQEN